MPTETGLDGQRLGSVARVPYAQALPMARMVYTPEMAQKARAARAKAGEATTASPTYLPELHNRLALVTQ